ncbi:MAG: Gfo/Idh/MocA family oxidoreductase, partial [Acidobacteriaceae bacterium]
MSINRRHLLQGLTLGALSAKLPFAGEMMYGETQASASQKPVSANDRISLGVIGPGSRGKELIRQFLKVPGVEITAVCDVYPPRFAEVDEFVGRKVPGVKDYRELIDRKDIDVIAIATPPVFHASYSIAAMESG